MKRPSIQFVVGASAVTFCIAIAATQSQSAPGKGGTAVPAVRIHPDGGGQDAAPHTDAGPEDAAPSSDAAPTFDGAVKQDAALPACDFTITDDAKAAAAGKLKGIRDKAPDKTIVDGTNAFIVVGPDGKAIGPIPRIREDFHIYVVLYRPSTNTPYRVTVDGCQPVPTRYLGQPEESLKSDVVVANSADVQDIGQCSASQALTFHISVPEQPGCSQREESFTATTENVYSLVAALAGVFWIGDTQAVGVDVGAGGQPSHAFQRNQLESPGVRLGVFWFPLGYSENEPWLTAPSHKIFLGTVVEPSRPLSDLNVVIGTELTTGISIFAGIDICRDTRSLAGGIHDGDVYQDNSASLPTTETFSCSQQRAVLGVAITATALAGILAR